MKSRLCNVSKQFDGKTALSHVSLEIDPGCIVVVLGKNGAGKSTLLQLLAGLLSPTEGRVEYDDEPFGRDRMDLRKRLAFLPDVPPVFSDSTPLEHVGMCLRVYDAHRPGVEDAVVELFREFELLALAETPINTLSRGQAYKAALVGVLAVDPEIWLLDEPFAAGMDPPGVTAFRRHARQAALRGRTIVYSTQIVEVAESFSDEIVILDEGEIRFRGSLEEMRRRRGSDVPVLEQWFEEMAAGP